MNCNSCPESKLILKDGEPAEMVMDPNSETCKNCMDELIKDTIERHKESLDMLAKDDGPVLKPCPFCGSADVHLMSCLNIREPEKMVFCMKCGAAMISGWFKEEDERLIEMWNRRVKE